MEDKLRKLDNWLDDNKTYHRFIWWIDNAKWWHFWNPGSGSIGGCIFGIILATAFMLLI